MGDSRTPGFELPRLRRTMTEERMRWYSDALHTVTEAAAVPLSSGANIHTDDAVARANGLPGRVADGMISTNWISGLLAEAYGDDYLARGSLRTRYVRPIFVDDRIEVVVRISSREETPDGTWLLADVSCLKATGEVATAGQARIALDGQA